MEKTKMEGKKKAARLIDTLNDERYDLEGVILIDSENRFCVNLYSKMPKFDAMVVFKDGCYKLTSLSSKKIYVRSEGKGFKEAENYATLTDGDSIKVGNYTLQFKEEK